MKELTQEMEHVGPRSLLSWSGLNPISYLPPKCPNHQAMGYVGLSTSFTPCVEADTLGSQERKLYGDQKESKQERSSVSRSLAPVPKIVFAFFSKQSLQKLHNE